MSNVKGNAVRLIFGIVAMFAIWATIKDCRFDAPPPLQPVVTKKIPSSSGSLLARADLLPLFWTDDLAGHC